MSHIDYNEDNPGPGAYWLNYKHVLPQAPIQSIAIHLPIWFDYDKPGPGTYNVRKDRNDSPKYTIAEKNKWFPWAGVPGPGTYYLEDHVKHTNIRVPAYTIPEKNKWFPWGGVPGPGTYNLREGLPDKEDQAYYRNRRHTTKGSPVPDPGPFRKSPAVGAFNPRSQEFSGPRYTMGQRMYRLRDMKRERRWSAALKHRPRRKRDLSPAKSPPAARSSQSDGSPERKHSHHQHVKPEVPRRSSKIQPRTSAVGTQVDLPPPAAPGAPPPAASIVPKSNAWMDVGKRLQKTRDGLTAAANIPDPEPPPPPPPPEGEGEGEPPPPA